MKVNIEELNRIVTLLLLKLKEVKGNEIELRNDYYWDISSGQLYNPYDMPVEMSLGQISDDLSELHRLSVSQNEAIAYDLKRVAEILKVLSIENSTTY